MTPYGKCVCCDNDGVGIATAEVAESGNWIKGPFCSRHLPQAKRFGRVTATRKLTHGEPRGKRVSKPDWAADWQADAPRSERGHGYEWVVTPEMRDRAKESL